MKFEIRESNLNDIEFITALTWQMGYKTTDEKIQQRLAEIAELSDQCFFVAEKHKKVIGWIHAFRTLRVESGTFVEIGGMVVDEDYRGKGAGKALIDKIVEWSLKKGERKIRVRCNVHRPDAHGFYELLGFEEVKEQKIFDKQIA
ncbi:MAG: GNAT family N-acetyltransferase [Bacteroidales bacterium]|nr:GNAT family N-acetyltransferase [Bacteroidales bacterium]